MHLRNKLAFVKMIAFQSEPLWKIKPLCPLFSYTSKPSQGKREKRKQKASREQQEWEHGKYENYWVSIVFIVFHMLRKCSGLSFYVSCFMFPVFCLHVFCWYVPCFIVFLPMLFPVQNSVNILQSTTQQCGTLKVITFLTCTF